MERQDYRVQRPWSATVVQTQQSGEVVETGTRIIEVFDRPELARQLLILGEPGAGKTTMMLELAQDLLYRARTDKAEPIPVLLNLSAWKNPKQSIFEWLLSELRTKHGLNQALALQWLRKHQMLPLLDGLDEVAPQHQKACALALNTWLTGELAQQPCGVLVCCRREEFEQVVQQPLSLYGAIYLQALNPQQIEHYFAQFELQDVWQTVHQDVALQELLTKPLFLSMFGLVATQLKFSISDWQARTTSEQKIEYLFDTYWEAAIERELILDPVERQRGIRSKTYGINVLPSRQEVRRSLVFAAKMLNYDSSTELLIEKIQPTVLLTQQQKWSYQLVLGIIFGLSVGLISGLVINITSGLILGLHGSLIAGFVGRLHTIEPIEAISISMSLEAWREVLRSIQRHLIIRLIAILTPVLISILVGVLISVLILVPIGMLITLFVGTLIPILVSSFIGGLIDGFKADIQIRTEPNQGIKNSFKNMVIVSAIAVATILPFKIFLEKFLIGVVDVKNIPGIVSGSIFCLVLFSSHKGGGQALIQHLALRIVLAWNRYAPFRYDLLLNYCTERLLLQRIGGRYRFMHKLLQDHFAKMDL
nr:NACHT domain-containing protein [Trichocoleus sp. FACHB-591]